MDKAKYENIMYNACGHERLTSAYTIRDLVQRRQLAEKIRDKAWFTQGVMHVI
jgi:hypothetical protein